MLFIITSQLLPHHHHHSWFMFTPKLQIHCHEVVQMAGAPISLVTLPNFPLSIRFRTLQKSNLRTKSYRRGKLGTKQRIQGFLSFERDVELHRLFIRTGVKELGKSRVNCKIATAFYFTPVFYITGVKGNAKSHYIAF